MKLSILDQVPIPIGTNVEDAFSESVKLAKAAENLGYNRYWIAEHHDFKGLACPNPDTLITLIGSQTKKIRLGAGAVLLPHYSPFKIAETYNLLSVLFPSRIDLGLGRAPGGSAETSIALSGNYLENVKTYPESVKILKSFINNNEQDNPLFNNITASPLPEVKPEMWMLGTSEKSAELAIKNNLNYVFGHFMSSVKGPEIIEKYNNEFFNKYKKHPKVIIAVSVICAETTIKAKEIARATALWSGLSEAPIFDQIPSYKEANEYKGTPEIEEKIDKALNKMIIGNPKTVSNKLRELAKRYDAMELMLVTNTYNYRDRLNSFKLIAEEMQLSLPFENL